MSILTENYLDHYTPLVEEFVREVASLSHPDIDGMPEPFFPVFGSGYERSALRLIIVGQDTRGWGDLMKSLPEWKADPRAKLKDWMDEFADSPPRWGGPRHQFGGFVGMLLAALHGLKDWSVLRKGGMDEVLSSFAWGNGNAVELYQSTPSKIGVPWEYWEAVRKAGAHFDRFSHLVETLKPRAAIVLWRGMDPATYFEGYSYEVLPEDGRLKHYRLPEIGVDVFQVPHPRSMGFIEGADHFCTKLRDLFFQHGITKPFPEFLKGQSEAQDVMDYLQRNAPSRGPSFDKYAFVSWVAEELRKRDTFMSVPALIGLVNAQGYRTNYDTEYSVPRGYYKLVSGTYHRLESAGEPNRARNVALAFRKPNFDYAYDTE